jgi:hypothetical protein
VIFTEKPVLHTAHPIARVLNPASTTRLNLAFDWQRLLYLYAYLRRTATSMANLDLAMSALSTAGVTSQQARSADPEREGEYREVAREWVHRYKETRKKKKAAQRKKKKSSSVDDEGTSGSVNAQTESSNTEKEWTPTIDEIARLIAILETNSHSRDEDDQRDLEDPRLDTPSTKNFNLSNDDDENHVGDDKDEACGLWIVASLMNHSCIPNCTVVISPSPPSGELPILTLRCIRPIAAGDSLTISYHDEELAPTEERQAQLSGRGFTCVCALCSGEVREYTRAAVCSACTEGVCCPQKIEGKVHWKCDCCVAELDKLQQDAFRTAEEGWMSHWENILELMSGIDLPPKNFPPLRLLQALSERAKFPETTIFNIFDSLSLVELGLAPLHFSHGHIYAFLKYILFEQSFWLRTLLGDAGVTGVLFAMVAIVERGLGQSTVSEERRVLGFWLSKEATAQRERGQLDELNDARWRRMEIEGFQRWEAGMRYLYGRIA